MFTLDAGSVELRLEVVPVRSLLQHERTLESTIKKLIFEFKNWANLQNPIIVDENHVVLDGNHRARVFQALEYSYIPVCKIDYFNDSVKLRYWFRHLRHVPSRADVEEVFHESRCELGLLTGAREIIPELEKDPLKFGFRMGEWFGTGKFPTDQVTGAVEVYDALENLQELLKRGNITLEYIPCQFMNDGE
ncbi:hypothetical protein GF325_13730, partial [Candidatus Bathyarchaeota archaeon]|nr:hypothetical protein [Candidatus Bathyarchaeota archaeon]